MTGPYLDVCCLVLTLFPGLPSAGAALAYEEAYHSQPHAGFRAGGEGVLPELWALAPTGEHEGRDAA